MPEDGSTSTKKLSDEEYRAYLDERRALLESELDYAKSFDRWVITLSGGALGLSIAFTQGLVAPGPASKVWALGIAWAVFGLAIVAALCSIHLSQTAHERFRDILDRIAAEGGDRFFDRVREAQQSEKLPMWIGRLNRASVGAFLVGVAFLGVFFLTNL